MLVGFAYTGARRKTSVTCVSFCHNPKVALDGAFAYNPFVFPAVHIPGNSMATVKRQQEYASRCVDCDGPVCRTVCDGLVSRTVLKRVPGPLAC